MKTIRKGAEGADVDKLHELLIKSGAEESDKFGFKFDRWTHSATLYFQQTHLDKRGKQLVPDGVVGPSTWWSLKHQTGKAQKSNIVPSIPHGLGDDRRLQLRVALKEHEDGVREKPNGSNRSKGIDKYLPSWITKKKKKGPPWCAFFWSWCDQMHHAGKYSLGRRMGSCMGAIRLAKKKGMWTPCGEAQRLPIPGDAFVMDKGNGKGHIGLVLRVSVDGKRMNTIEGNCGNRVKVGLREINDEIAGFINTFGDAANPPPFKRGLKLAPKVGKHTTR